MWDVVGRRVAWIESACKGCGLKPSHGIPVGIVCAALFFAANAAAYEVPRGGYYDTRMRTVAYNPRNVTVINGHFGYTTHIQFEASEVVTDVAMGDPQAWACEVRGNHIFLKPYAENADTNMSVLTNVRTYMFDLKAHKRSVVKANAYYLVTFLYPVEEKQRAEKARKEQLLKDRLDNNSIPIPANWNYWKVGHELISPVEAFDDKVFTYLKFPNNRDMPAVYKENLDGSEALVNSHVNGNTIIVQSIERKLVLRKGKLAATVMNGSFDPDGVSQDSGMTVRGVKRTVKGQ
jgi:type IV secretion system protein VirB9